MNEKDLQEFNAALDKKLQEVQQSPEAARRHLEKLGMLTPDGKLKSSFLPHVSR
jgi:hypothetical protein